MSIILQDSNLLWWLSLILRGWGWCQGPLSSLRTRVTSLHAGQGAAPCLTLLSAPPARGHMVNASNMEVFTLSPLLPSYFFNKVAFSIFLFFKSFSFALSLSLSPSPSHSLFLSLSLSFFLSLSFLFNFLSKVFLCEVLLSEQVEIGRAHV